MFNGHKTSEKDIDELGRVVEEYRSRIDELLRKEKERQRQLADEKTSYIITSAEERAQSVIAESQRRARQIAAEIEQKAQKEADRLLAEARFKAEQTIREADERIKKGAKEKARKELENIIKKTKEEANSILEFARRESEKESNNIIARAKLEAEHLKSKTVDDARKEAQAEADKMVAESRLKAEKTADNTIERLKEMNNILNESILKVDTFVSRFRREVQAELEEVSRAVAESSKKLAEVIAVDMEERGNGKKTETEGRLAVNGNGKSKVIGAVVDIRADRIINEDGGRLFKGRMELTVVPPYNSAQIKKLVDSIVQVPTIRRAGEYGSEEEGAKVIFDINEPVPLLNVLGKIPIVISAVDEGESIKLMLKP